MHIVGFKQTKITSRYIVISTLLVFLLLVGPVSVFAEDDSSIETLRQMGRAFANIAEKVSPSVVGIRAEKTVSRGYSTRDLPFGEQFDPFRDDLFDWFFRQPSPRRRSPQRRSEPQRQLQQAQGSGFIISADGYIITSNHLVGEADKVVVKFGDESKSEIEAEVIGTDPDSDVAVIKIDVKEDVPYLELADSDALEVGEWVIAIGNPFGLSHTVTAGIVSAKGRSGFSLTTYEDFIQTDAAINPGNSGGPLLNLDGKVVGINTFIISRSGGNMGIGFAIPINMAKGIYDQLVESGTVVRGFLGVSIQDLNAELAESFGLKDTKGVLIPDIIADSAADKSDLKQGDVIIELDGRPVEKASELQKRVALLKPGTKVTLVVLRDGKRKTVKVELGERPKGGVISGAPSETLEQLDFTVQNLTDDLAERLGYEGMSGVIVTEVEPGSEAARKGIAAGILIMEVNRESVANTKEFDKALEKVGEGRTVLLRITDGRYARYVPLKLSKE